MIEFTVVRHEIDGDTTQAVLKSEAGNYIFFDDESSLRLYPLGSKFVLLPANLAVAPLFEQKLDQLTDTTLSVMQRAK